MKQHLYTSVLLAVSSLGFAFACGRFAPEVAAVRTRPSVLGIGIDPPADAARTVVARAIADSHRRCAQVTPGECGSRCEWQR